MGVGDVRFEVVDVTASLAQRAMAAYFAELGTRLPGGFDPAGGGAETDADRLCPPRGAFVLAVPDGENGAVIGCGGLQGIDEATVEIKRMWVDSSARGIGLGRRLLDELERIARSLGYERVVLDTHATLTEAIALYERSGYERVDPYNDNPYADHWFAKRLTEPRI